MTLLSKIDSNSYSDAFIIDILNNVKSIAMVGASAKWNRPSNFAMKYLIQKGYNVIPVNKSDENLTFPELASERMVLSSFVLTGFVFAGFIGLPLGAHIVITSATNFANAVGVSEEVIGLTVVAIGTSLPELATSMAAAFRKQVSLLLGNVILFQILL